jgi:4-carboxymuconolactone decarboxylase
MDTSKYDETEGFKQGLQVRREVLGDSYVEPSIRTGAEDPFSHDLQQFVTEYCWGTVWCRPGLERKTRSIINLALLSALGRTHELKLHLRGALNNGVTKDEIKEVFLQVGVYAGVPAAVEAFRTGREVFADIEKK